MYPLDRRNKADGLKLLRATPSNYSKLIFFDPQHREVLDYLKLGNEGARQKGRVKLPQMATENIKQLGEEIVRVLKPSGYAATWIDKFILCNGLAQSFYGDELQIVDMITWNKGKIGMGHRSRRKGEYLIFLQKPPILAKHTWRRKPCIGDIWDEKITDRVHVHQKPHGLQKALIEAITNKGDVVMCPTAGSFSVMYAAHACGRHFLGCDILGVNRPS